MGIAGQDPIVSDPYSYSKICSLLKIILSVRVSARNY